MLFNCGTVVKSFQDIPKRGFTVSKYGAASGHTVGHLNQECVAVRGLEGRSSEGNAFSGQLEVIPLKGRGDFATQGDSGCLAFIITEGYPYTIKALGMYIGTYSYGGCVVTPIWAILQKFNLPLQLLSFPVQRQEAEMDVMEEDTVSERVTNLENNVKHQETAITKMTENVGYLGAQMKTVNTKVNANEQASNINRYLIDEVKQETMGHNAGRQPNVSEPRRQIGMVIPLPTTSSTAKQESNQAASGAFLFGACNTEKAEENQDKSEKERPQDAPGKPTMHVKPRSTI